MAFPALHPSLTIVLVGAVYLAAFSGLALLRRQRPSLRFAVEVAVLTAIGAALPLASVRLGPILFLVVLYLLTMRVRLVVDVGNYLTARGRFRRALALFRLALRLGPDSAGRQIVAINQGVTQLRMKEPEAAYLTLKAVLIDEQSRPGARYLAAGFYNLGVACLRVGRRQEAISSFHKAIESLPGSIFAQAAAQALKREGLG
jgi:tetratricopeptide (TPR) repeat protein